MCMCVCTHAHEHKPKKLKWIRIIIRREKNFIINITNLNKATAKPFRTAIPLMKRHLMEDFTIHDWNSRRRTTRFQQYFFFNPRFLSDFGAKFIVPSFFNLFISSRSSSSHSSHFPLRHFISYSSFYFLPFLLFLLLVLSSSSSFPLPILPSSSPPPLPPPFYPHLLFPYSLW